MSSHHLSSFSIYCVHYAEGAITRTSRRTNLVESNPHTHYPPIEVNMTELQHTTGHIIYQFDYGLDIDSLIFTTTPYLLSQMLPKGAIIQLGNQLCMFGGDLKNKIIIFKYGFTVLTDQLPYSKKKQICDLSSEFGTLHLITDDCFAHLVSIPHLTCTAQCWYYKVDHQHIWHENASR